MGNLVPIQKLKYLKKNSKNKMATSEMSKEEVNAYRKAFDHFDKNNDGTINIKELEDVMKSMGKDPSKEELQGEKQVWTSLDKF